MPAIRTITDNLTFINTNFISIQRAYADEEYDKIPPYIKEVQKRAKQLVKQLEEFEKQCTEEAAKL